MSPQTPSSRNPVPHFSCTGQGAQVRVPLSPFIRHIPNYFSTSYLLVISVDTTWGWPQGLGILSKSIKQITIERKVRTYQ